MKNVFSTLEFMQCLIELYKCQEIGQTNCPQAKGCVLIEPVVTEESETEDYVEGSGVVGSYLPPGDGSVGLGSNSQIGSAHGSVSSSAETPSGLVTSTTNNPVHGGVGGNNRKSNKIFGKRRRINKYSATKIY